MKTYVCSICGFVYDEAKGIPQAGIAPGTLWEALPENWVCPLCGAAKALFREQGAKSAAPKTADASVSAPEPETMTRLTLLETSALCSNLAKGCEKQYLGEEAALFTRLADYCKGASAPASEPKLRSLAALTEQDLADGFPAAHEAAAEAQDRGALRALVWSEKVTRILNSLLIRCQEEGDNLTAQTAVYVCTICGFVYVGDTPPALCPICKVPAWKFEKVEEGVQS